jgi:DNA-binding NarL/FixJ family response regulator
MDVLLVDDEPKNLMALSALLEDLGARIHCVNSGEDALRQVLKRQFAAILLDVRMPGSTASRPPPPSAASSAAGACRSSSFPPSATAAPTAATRSRSSSSSRSIRTSSAAGRGPSRQLQEALNSRVVSVQNDTTPI